MKISLCITNHNRNELLMQSFAQVIQDERVSEIIISDDCSDRHIYETIKCQIDHYPKVRLFRNDKNVGMSLNKKLAVEHATNEWCCIFDSDNILTPQYLDALNNFSFQNDIIAAPSFAMPQFDYRKFTYWLINKSNVGYFLTLDRIAECFLNTCNYVVNRKKYLEVYAENKSMKATDTIWFNYLWLKNNGYFIILPGMHYFHRVHGDSGFMKDCDYNMTQSKIIKELIIDIKKHN